MVQAHLNNKQKYKPVISRQDYHLTQPCPSEENKQQKISPCRKLTQTTGSNLGGQKPKGRKNSTLKPGKKRPQTQEVKKKKKRKGREILHKRRNELETQKSK